VHDVDKYRSVNGLSIDPGAMNNAGSWPGPRTSHHDFDLNRDWYAQSHPETRGRAKTFLNYMPHGAAFDTHGWSYFRREGDDSFYPGYGEGWPVRTVNASLPAATSYRTGNTAALSLKTGSYVVDFAQPQAHLAKALLEANAYLDWAYVKFELELRRPGQRNRFYDATGWSLPYTFRVDAYTVPAMPSGLAKADVSTPAAPAAARAQYGYAFAPGSEETIRRVQPNRAEVHDVVMRRAAQTGVTLAAIASAGVDEGTDLGSNSVVPIPRPSIALLGGAPVNGTPFGFAWYALDQRIGYPTSMIDANYIAGGDLSQYTTIVMPSVQAGALDRLLGDGGRQRLVEWVRNGGVLITMEGASAWVAQERVGLVRTRVKRDSARADSAGGAPLPGGLPGVIARATVDSLSPLTAYIAISCVGRCRCLQTRCCWVRRTESSAAPVNSTTDCTEGSQNEHGEQHRASVVSVCIW